MRASVRATPDDGEGTFEALVSSYAETYEIGGWFGSWTERILPGCFADSIADHPTIPVCWNHDWKAGPIGHGAAQELDIGLIVRGELYLDLDPMVQRVYRSMKAKAVEEWSIAFFPERIVNDDAEPYCDQIERGDLIEATACFRGANPGTETLDLRGAPVVSVDGDAKAEVVRLRKLFSVPEVRIGSVDALPAAMGATATMVFNGQPYVSSTLSTIGTSERLVRGRARLAKMRADEAADTPGESVEESEMLDEILDELDAADAEAADLETAEEPDLPAEAPADPPADEASSELRRRLLSSRAGCAAVLAQARSASGSPSSPSNDTTL